MLHTIIFYIYVYDYFVPYVLYDEKCVCKNFLLMHIVSGNHVAS